MRTVAAATNQFSSTLPTVASVDDGRPAWNRAIERLHHARLAHAVEWSTAIQRAYGHEPLYLTSGDDEQDFGVLPAFVVRRPLFGAVVTSMPFLDGGGPCSTSPLRSRLLLEQLIAEAYRRGAKFIDVRCAEPLPTAAPVADHKVNLRLPLPERADTLWHQFDKSVRNQIRKAERSGLSFEFGRQPLLASFYEIFVERMRDLGSPAHDLRWFEAILDSFGPRARIAVVKKGTTTVGGLIALAFKDDLTVPWAACSKDHFALCPNMLLYWETIRTACADGFARFDFGRSTRQSGTYRFKRQWGAQEEPLFWYRIPIASAVAPVTAEGGSGAFITRAWRRLPVTVTRRVGPRIRRYLIQ
jgi:FemAB-related protein (PEP-CTERM system-associated)